MAERTGPDVVWTEWRGSEHAPGPPVNLHWGQVMLVLSHRPPPPPPGLKWPHGPWRQLPVNLDTQASSCLWGNETPSPRRVSSPKSETGSPESH